jgi:Tfp pilus assembly protein PilF
MRIAALAVIGILALSGCASGPLRDFLQPSKGSAALSSGLHQYENGQYAEAARNLQAAIDLGLTDRESTTAHKHLAFIHCASGRERACREEFRKALAIDPQLELAPAEAGHPAWGRVFSALKGSASPSSYKLALQQYEAGEYAESARNLQAAIDLGLPERERADAHKHLAFIHCASGRERPCRDEFRKALAVNPELELDPAEAGHPAWGPAFRSLKGSSAPLKLALQQYEAGEYDESAKTFQGAIDEGLAEKELANAHKHLAFIHCAAGRQRPCRDEFRKALSADPELELDPAEAGHPVWGPIFRAVKAGR